MPRSAGAIAAALNAVWGPKIVSVVLMDVVELYERDPHLFYEMGCMGLPNEAAPWLREAHELALRIHSFMERGFNPDRLAEGALENTFDDPLHFASASASRVAAMMAQLCGQSAVEPGREAEFRRGKAYGKSVSRAEVEFKLGPREG